LEMVDSRELPGEIQDVEVRDVEGPEVGTREEAASKEPVEAVGHALLRMQTRVVFKEEGPLRGMVGNSRATQQVHALARTVAPRGTTVLIMGETCTGKEFGGARNSWVERAAETAVRGGELRSDT
jgi:transcriptional regulator with PAS, ATPase and Fis domain